MSGHYSDIEAANLPHTGDRTLGPTRSIILLAAASVGMSGGYTAIFAGTAGVFLLPIASSLGEGRGVASGCMAMSSLGLAVGAPFVGRLMDRHGAYRVIRGSVVLFALSLLLLAVRPLTIGLLGFKIFLLGLVGVATSPVGYLPILAHSFERRLGLAFGVASIGAGVGAAIMPLCAGFAIRAFGWQIAYALLGLVGAILGTVALQILRCAGVNATEKRAAAPAVSNKKPLADRVSTWSSGAFSTLQFWLIAVSIALVAAVGLGSMVHIPALLIDKGMSVETAASGAAFSAIGLTVGRFVAGMLLDHLPGRVVAAGLFLLGAIGAWILALPSHLAPYPLLALGAALTGMLIGAEGDLMPFLVKRYFGLDSFGRVYGLTISVFCLGTLAGPIAFGMAFDRFHSYVLVMSTAGVACVVGAIAILAIGPYKYPGRSSLTGQI